MANGTVELRDDDSISADGSGELAQPPTVAELTERAAALAPDGDDLTAPSDVLMPALIAEAGRQDGLGAAFERVAQRYLEKAVHEAVAAAMVHRMPGVEPGSADVPDVVRQCQTLLDDVRTRAGTIQLQVAETWDAQLRTKVDALAQHLADIAQNHQADMAALRTEREAALAGSNSEFSTLREQLAQIAAGAKSAAETASQLNLQWRNEAETLTKVLEDHRLATVKNAEDLAATKTQTQAVSEDLATVRAQLEALRAEAVAAREVESTASKEQIAALKTTTTEVQTRVLQDWNAQLAAAVTKTSQDLAQALGTAEVALADARDAFGKQMDGQATAFSTEHEERDLQFKKAETERADAALEAERKRNADAASAQTNAKQRVEDLFGQTKRAVDTAIAEHLEALTKQRDFGGTAEKELQGHLDRIRNLAGLAGMMALSGHHSKRALEDDMAARRWRLGAIGAGLLAVVIPLVLFYSVMFPDKGGKESLPALELVIMRAALSVTAYVLFAYCARVASGFQTTATRNYRVAAELASLDSYLASLKPEAKDGVKERLAEKFFGSGEATAKSEPSSAVELVKSTTDLVKTAAGSLADVGKAKSG